MGRKLTFCKDKALDQAIQLFWRKGYEATSMRDVATALDIPLASVYHSFGDKKSIFTATLDGYVGKYVQPSFDALRQQEDACAAIISFFDSMIASCVGSDDAPPGCYLVQVAGQLRVTEPDLAALAMERLDAVRMQFKELIERAQNQKQLSADRNSEDLSNYLLATMLAAKTWMRAGVAAQVLKNYLDLALAPLRQDRK